MKYLWLTDRVAWMFSAKYLLFIEIWLSIFQRPRIMNVFSTMSLLKPDDLFVFLVANWVIITQNLEIWVLNEVSKISLIECSWQGSSLTRWNIWPQVAFWVYIHSLLHANSRYHRDCKNFGNKKNFEEMDLVLFKIFHFSWVSISLSV